MAESYSVKAVLSADVSKFTSGITTAQSKLGALSSTIGGGLGFGVLAGVGTAAFNAITGAIKGTVTGVVDAGSSFDSTMSKVQAITGASAAEFETLSAKAKEMGSTTVFSATEASEAMTYMGMAGWKTEDIISGLSGVMNLAAAAGSDLATTSDILTDALTAFGKSASESTRLADIMAATATNSNTNVELMGETFKYVATTAGALGFSMEDTATAIGLMANSGVKGSQAGTALKNVLVNLSKPTDAMKTAMDQLGISLTDSEGNMNSLDTIMKQMRTSFAGLTEAEKANYAATIAGKYGMSGLLAIVNASEEDFNNLSAAIANSSDGMGAASEMADTMLDNFEGDVTLMKSAWEGFSISLWDKIQAPARLVVQAITTMINKAQSVIENSTIMSGLIDGISAVATAFNDSGLDGAIQAVSDSFGDLQPAIASIGTAIAGAFVFSNLGGFLNGAASINAGITGLGSTFSTAGSAVTGFLGKINFTNASNSLLNFAVTAEEKTAALGAKIPALAPKFSSLGSKVSNAMLTAGAGIEGIGTKFSSFASVIPTGLQSVTGAIGTFGTSSITLLNSFMGMALRAVAPGAIIAVVIAGLGTLYSQFGTQIDSLISMMAEKGPAVVANFCLGIANQLPTLISQGATLISNFLSGITANIPTAIAGGVSIINGLVTGLAEAAPTLITSMATTIMSLITSVASNIPSMIASGAQLLLGLAQGIVSAIPTIITGAVSAIQGFISGLSTNLPNIITTGIQLIVTLVAGIISAIPQLISAIPTIFSSFVQGLASIDWIQLGKDILTAIGDGIIQGVAAIGGPVAKLFNALGFDMTESAATGIDEGAPNVEASTTAMTDSMAQAMEAMNSQSALMGVSCGTNYADGLTPGFDSAVSYVDASGSAIESSLAYTDENVSAYADSMAESVATDTAAMAESASTNAGAFSDSITGMSTVYPDLSGTTTEVDSVATSAETASTKLDSLTTTIQTTISKLKSMKTASSQVAQGMKSAFNGVTNSVRSSMNQLSAAVSNGMNAARTAATGGMTGIRSAMTAGLNGVVASARTAMNQFAAAITTGGATARSNATNVSRNVVNALKSANASSAGTSLVQGFASGISSSSGSAASAARSVVSNAAAQFGGYYGTLYSYGADMVRGYINGIDSMMPSLTARVNQLAKLAAEAVRTKNQIGSPSRVMAKLGKWIAVGYANGMKAEFGNVQRTADQMMDLARPAWNYAPTGFSDEAYNAATTGSNLTLNTAVVIDGREIAQATAEYDQDAQNRLYQRQQRKLGYV